ncbi:MAG: TIGR02757 family protein [Owenweeksia sp.]|nr:TIGR02757 family protein [Owenweeksia sp.]
MNKLKELLEAKAAFYNRPAFVETDPIQVPHRFTLKEDIEISGFLTATIAWGQRPTILNNAQLMMNLMDHAPYDFVMHHQLSDLRRFAGFVHRTFNADDLAFFVQALKGIYQFRGGLEEAMAATPEELDMKKALGRFRAMFFEKEHLSRTEKHLSNPFKKSACKRLNMFLRWMVRSDQQGVDFGIWQKTSPAQLSCPLDVHSGNVARNLGLLKRSQNDWRAVEELDANLRKMDPEDPVKYDFALFGMGVFEKIT